MTACLVADGHPPVSTLKLAWIYGDKAERRRIEALLDDAMMSTLHKWA